MGRGEGQKWQVGVVRWSGLCLSVSGSDGSGQQMRAATRQAVDGQRQQRASIRFATPFRGATALNTAVLRQFTNSWVAPSSTAI